MDSLRISLPHQLFGAESSLLGTTDFYETEEQRRGSTKDGQPNRHSLRQQDGRTNPITTLHPSIADLGVVPEAQYHSPRRIPSRERQYRSRLGVTSPEGQQRLATIATGVQNPEQPARSILYRPVCLQDQRPIRALLQLEAGSRSHSSGCLLGVLGTRETIPIPTVQYDRKSSDQDSRRDSRVCLPHSSSLASTDMVSAVVEDVGEDANTSAQHPRPSSQPRTVPTSIGDRGEDVSSRLAHLRQGFAVQGFSDRVTSLLLQSWREHTHSAYNSAWKKWCSWCLTKQINPFSAPIAAVLEFLTDNFDLGLQYRTVNTLRSAISTTHATIDNHTVGTHPLVVRLLKGMFNTRPPVPRYNGAWDVTPVVQSLRRSSEGLTTLQLSKKVVTLLALSNADRCSDLAALDRDYMRWTASGVQFTVVQITKTRTSGPPRTVFYPMLREDPDICPVTTLRKYITVTTPCVANFETPKPVFITSRKPFRRARPATIGHWIKDTLKAAGVDTEKFTAHSTRSASTSHASMKGVPIADILKVANWSSSSTFERFYHRSSDPSAFARAVL